jgi:Protein of unknown function (DUF2795)
MTEVNPTLVESLIEGMPLPARRDEIVEYAQIEGAEEDLLDALRALPDREYESADDIGETLRPAQPNPPAEEAPEPRAESGDPPGGGSYTA